VALDPSSILTHRLGIARVRRSIPLAQYTTFRIGGPADLFYEATAPNELARAVSAAREADIPFFVLGLGANLLIGDAGFRGLVIRNRADGISVQREAHRVVAGSGATMYPDLIEAAVSSGLSGLEHFAGIPSTVGGALWQNLHFLSPAPARERTVFIEEVVVSARLLLENGESRVVGVDYFEFGYDWSILHRTRDIVLEATFQLTPGPESEMRRVMRENLLWRSERHPPLDTEPSAGSIFKKIDGVGAGRLIDGCGLKGKRIGGAEVSPRHANILINRGGATARDVRELIDLVQHTVHRETGYLLEPEIGLVGEF
jgi:UDP-N-acetylmuramate dehydrogenase